MSKCVRMLAGMFFFGALAIGAKAQELDQITVKVPYAFVVGDKTLPPGEYRVNRIRFDGPNELALTSLDNNKAGAIIVSSEAENVARQSTPKLVFEKIGDEHLLAEIQTAEHVFVVPVSRRAILQATAKPQPAAVGSASGSN